MIAAALDLFFKLSPVAAAAPAYFGLPENCFVSPVLGLGAPALRGLAAEANPAFGEDPALLGEPAILKDALRFAFSAL